MSLVAGSPVSLDTRGLDDPGEGWQLFDVARIEDAQVLRITFTPRPRAQHRGWTAGVAAPAAEAAPPATALAAAAEVAAQSAAA